MGSVRLESPFEWNDPGAAHAFRCFRACHRTVADKASGNRRWSEGIEVYTNGIQYADGRIKRDIAVGPLHADDPITVEHARTFVAKLRHVSTRPVE